MNLFMAKFKLDSRQTLYMDSLSWEARLVTEILFFFQKPSEQKKEHCQTESNLGNNTWEPNTSKRRLILNLLFSTTCNVVDRVNSQQKSI